MQSATAPRLIRDSATWLLYGQLAVWAYYLYGLGPVVPLLRGEQHTTRAVAGLHASVFAVGALISAAWLPRIVRRYGRDKALWGGIALLCTGTLALTLGHEIAITLTGATVAAIGGMAVGAAVPPALAETHNGAGAAAITEANAIAAGIGLLAPLAVGGAVAIGWGWRPALFVTVLLGVTVAVAARYRRIAVPAGRSANPQTLSGRPTGRLPGRFWIAWLILLFAETAELSINYWVADELRGHAGLSAGVASAGLSAVLLGVVIGRVVGTRLALRFETPLLILGAIAGCLIGFMVFWLATAGWLALVGLVACGLGVAGLFPYGVALLIASSDGQPDLATARGMYAVGIASGAGPFALGALADNLTTHRAFLLVPAMLLLSALGVILLLIRQRRVITAGRGAVRRPAQVPTLGGPPVE